MKNCYNVIFMNWMRQPRKKPWDLEKNKKIVAIKFLMDEKKTRAKIFDNLIKFKKNKF